MKNLYKKFAETNRKFVYDNAKIPVSAESVKNSLEELKKSAKGKTSQDLEALKQDAAFSDALEKARNELNEYRKSLLNGETAPPGLTESYVSEIIKDTVDADDTNKLEAALGISMAIEGEVGDNEELDHDNVLDLDEFEKSQDFAGNNLILITEQLAAIENKTPQLEKLGKAVENSMPEILELEIKAKAGDLNENSKEKIEDQMESIMIRHLKLAGVDVGIMLAEFAKLARSNNSPQDIDEAMRLFVEANTAKPYSETKEVSSGMEQLYMDNPQLAKFFAEYYPPRNFEEDLNGYKEEYGIEITSTNFASELPKFFWNMKLDGGQSVADKLINFEGKYEELKAKITAESQNDAQAQSFGGGIMDMFNEFKGDLKSNMPGPFKNLDITIQDIQNDEITSVEGLFTSKMSSLLGAKTINFAGIKELSRPLDWEKDVDMLERLTGDIAVEYDDSADNFGEKYRQALKNGETRKTWQEWLDKDSGVTKMTRMGNSFKNILTKLARLLETFGLFPNWTEKYLGEKKEKYAKESVLQGEITTNKGDVEIEKIASENKRLWFSEKATDNSNYQGFIDFHKNNGDLLSFVNPSIKENEYAPHEAGDLDDVFGKTTPDEFKEWNSPKSREILEWAQEKSIFHEQISLDNWKFIVENRENLFIKKDGLHLIKPNFPTRKIKNWTDTDVTELSLPSNRESAFNELLNPKDGEGIFDESVNYEIFIKHKEELFVDPNDEDGATFKPFFAGLFSLDKTTFYSEKLSASDLKSLISNVKADKLDNDFNTSVETTESDNYWHMHNNKVQKVEDGVLVNKNTEKINNGEKTNVFALDFNGNWSLKDEKFSSVKALVERLKKPAKAKK